MHLPFDAVLLAGGRASRVGGVDKTAFTIGASTLLDRARGAAAHARACVVVGARDPSSLPAGVLAAREDPPRSGPVAALGAGLAALPTPASPFTLVLACDVARAPEAVSALFAGAERVDAAAGWIAIDDDSRRQPLLALYSRVMLDERLAALARDGGLEGRSLRQLFDGVALTEVAVPSELCADVDTPDDARRLGVVGATGPVTD